MRFCHAPLLIAALVLLTACRQAKVASYRAPHEQPEPLPPILTGDVAPGPAPSADMAATAVPTAGGDGLTWTAPAHWQAKPASAMRKGSYAVPGDAGATADLSITAFPGDVGGELANLNRWRSQIDLPPLAATEVASVTTHLDHHGLHFDVAEFVSAKPDNPVRILGAVIPFEGATWFVKLMGPDAIVAREKPAFLEFLQTIKPAAGATP